MADTVRYQDNATARSQHSIREYLADPMLCGRHFYSNRGASRPHSNHRRITHTIQSIFREERAKTLMGVYLVWESSQKGDYRVYSNLEQAAMRAEELDGTVYEIMPAGDARLFFIEDIVSGDIEVQHDVRLAAIAAIQEGEKFEFEPGRSTSGK
nr:MAG TPA: hypothetical protein [Caudoviricetes sp.]